MRISMRKVAAAGLSTAVLGGMAVLGTGTALAVDGSLTVTPATGGLINTPTVKTSAPCAAGTEDVFAVMKGGDPGFALPPDGQLQQPSISNVDFINNLSTTGSQLQFQFDTVRLNAGLPAYNEAAGTGGFRGTYTIELSCRQAFTITDTFTATLVWTGGPGQPNTYTFSAAAVDTSTVLSATPASPQNEGTSVTLSAAVTPSSGTAADVDSGQVEFFNGATSLGVDNTVVDGAASISTAGLPVGTNSLTAVYSAGTGFNTSTSSAISYEIVDVPAESTATAVSVIPTSAPAFSSVTLEADVTGATSGALGAGAGSVQFLANGSPIGAPVPLTATGATLVYNQFAAGAGAPQVYAITATFTPANPGAFNGSTGGPVDFTATPAAYEPDPQTVVVTVAAGTLTISTPYTPANPFDLGTLTLSADGLRLTASGAFGSAADPAAGVTITDSRAGDLPWTASVTSTDFTSGANSINAQNLSFTGVTPVYLPGNALNAATKPVVTNDVPTTTTNGYAPGAPGTDGLAGGPDAFATAANGIGSVNVIGNLNLVAPTSTAAGLYTATVTFTIA